MTAFELYQGDCLEIMPGLDKVDAVITSPPYDNLRDYEGVAPWSFDIFKKIADELYKVLKPGGVIVWVVGDATIDGSETGSSFRQALYFKEIGFNLHDTMIYQVNGVGAKGSNNAYWQTFEYMFIFSKGNPVTLNLIRDKKNKQSINYSKGRNTNVRGESNPTIVNPSVYSKRTNIWTYNAGMTNSNDRTDHPAPFPEALAKDHIVSWTNPGDIILDNFMGSGTTGKCCAQLNRRFVGIEAVPKYFKIAEPRIKTAYSQEVMF